MECFPVRQYYPPQAQTHDFRHCQWKCCKKIPFSSLPLAFGRSNLYRTQLRGFMNIHLNADASNAFDEWAAYPVSNSSYCSVEELGTRITKRVNIVFSDKSFYQQINFLIHLGQ